MKTMVSARAEARNGGHTTGGASRGSACENIKAILNDVSGKIPVFFLDYDGTLSPIVANPDKAFMPERSREVVRRLSFKFKTAIVTGRAKEKVKSFVKLDNLFYAGSHGLDIAGPKNSAVECKKFEKYVMEFKEGAEILTKALTDIPGAWVENNYLSLSVHYRASIAEDIPKVEAIVDDFIANESGKNMRKSQGKMVFELKLDTNWNKGAALMYILEALGLDEDEDVIPFYIGDDITDEDAFRAIANLRRGVSILVSENPKARPTLAQYSLANVEEVQDFLDNFARMFDFQTESKPSIL